MILCSQAKLENDNKSVNVKRGIRMKCEMGWRPGPSPLGYMNRSFGWKKDIIIDPERALIIKEAFEKVAYMYHSGQMVKEWMDKQGFTTKNGKRITQSMVYLMLKNPFYYGYFEFPVGSGKWYKGAHEPIITKEIFDDVQNELIDPRKRPHGINKLFPFKGLFKCYSCGSGICGEDKNRKLKYGGSRYHVYYHCTHSRNRRCKERYISERNLIKEILQEVKKIPDDKLMLTDKLQKAMKEYEKIIKEANYLSKYDFDGELTNRDYVEYIIRQGSIKARQDLVEILPIPKRHRNRKIV